MTICKLLSRSIKQSFPISFLSPLCCAFFLASISGNDQKIEFENPFWSFTRWYIALFRTLRPRRTLGGASPFTMAVKTSTTHALNDDEVYKVDASLYVTLDFTFPPETLRVIVIKRRDILKLWQSISKYITLYLDSTLTV